MKSWLVALLEVVQEANQILVSSQPELRQARLL